MSRHPDNPKWCDDTDQPISLYGQAEWDEAVEHGWLTPEHVADRLQGMALYQFGNGAEMGYGPEGFIVALVADAWTIEGNLKVRMNSQDHPPPHLHIEFRGERGRLRIRLDDGELMDERPRWLKRKQLGSIRGFIVAESAMLTQMWSQVENAAPPHA